MFELLLLIYLLPLLFVAMVLFRLARWIVGLVLKAAMWPVRYLLVVLRRKMFGGG